MKYLQVLKCRTIIALLIIVGLQTSLAAQNPDWVWAKNAGGTSTDDSYSISTDSEGNVYITGNFLSETISFDSIQLSNNGSWDIFIAKYNSEGNILWAKGAGGTEGDIANSIAVDSEGNVFITGSYSSDSISFDSTTLIGASNIFVVKFDTDGNVLWAKNANIIGTAVGTDLCTDNEGNVYLTGSTFGDSITFDLVTINTSGFFMVKFDSDGNALWGKGTSNIQSSNSSGESIALDELGNIYIAGDFNGMVAFDMDTIESFAWISVFILKLDNTGNVLWAKGSNGSNWFGGANVQLAPSANGDVYFAGSFNIDTITFDNISLGNSSENGSDYFILKYDDGGNILWAKTNEDGYGYELTGSIASDNIGNLYVSASYSSDSLFFGSDLLTSSGTYDGLVAKYDLNGNEIWAKDMGGSSNEIMKGVAVQEGGNIYATGYSQSNPCLFDSISLENYGNNDIFIAKLFNKGTSIEEPESLGTFNIFPNPFKEYAIIEFENPRNNNYTLRLYDMQGRLLQTIVDITANRVELNRNNLIPGAYLFELQSEQKEPLISKLIVE